MRSEGKGSFQAAARLDSTSAALQESEGRVFAAQTPELSSSCQCLLSSWKTGTRQGGTSQRTGDHSVWGRGSKPALWLIPSLKFSEMVCSPPLDVCKIFYLPLNKRGALSHLLLPVWQWEASWGFPYSQRNRCVQMTTHITPRKGF